MRIVLNGEEREVADGITVAGLLDTLEVSRRFVAVERNREIVPRAKHDETVLAEGDRIEIVTMVGRRLMSGDEQDTLADLGTLQVGEHEFESRLILGTGKYSTFQVMEDALEASGTELVTVAIRRVDLDGDGPNIFDHMDGYAILPNTAGCFDAEETIRTSRLAREMLDTDLLKLEVLYDQASLLPEPLETLKALDVLVAEGFTCMVYCGDDPVLAKRYEERGAAAVMPLGSSIGSGLGMLNPRHIAKIIENANVPVLVDAGLGVPSHVAHAMELGADGVIVNTAVAKAVDPVAMAHGMRLACDAGRHGYLAGRMAERPDGAPSSPVEGVVR